MRAMRPRWPQEAGAAALRRPRRAASEPLDAIAERARGRTAGLRRGAAQLLCFSTDDYAKPDGAKYHIGMGLKAAGDQERAVGGARRRPPLDARHRRVHDLVRGQDGRHRHRDDARRPRRHRDARDDRLLRGRRARGGFSLRALRRGLLDQPGAAHGPLPAQGRDRAGQRRRPRRSGIRTSSARSRSTTCTTSRDYSPWEGWEVRGWPVTTVLRGSVVVEDGELLGQPGRRPLAAAEARSGDRGGTGAVSRPGARRWSTSRAPRTSRWARSPTSSRAPARSGRRPGSGWSSRSRELGFRPEHDRPRPHPAPHADGRHGHPGRHEPVLLRPHLGSRARADRGRLRGRLRQLGQRSGPRAALPGGLPQPAGGRSRRRRDRGRRPRLRPCARRRGADRLRRPPGAAGRGVRGRGQPRLGCGSSSTTSSGSVTGGLRS